MANEQNLKPFVKGDDPRRNSTGLNKGHRWLSTILTEMLEADTEVTENGVKTTKKLADVIVRRLIKKANDGDMRAIKEIFDRIEGQATQTVNVNTPKQNPLQNLPEDKLDDYINRLESGSTEGTEAGEGEA